MNFVPIDNEPAILHRVSEGNMDAFRLLFRHYEASLYTAALHLLGDRVRAKDVCQDVFLKVWLKRETLVDIQDFSAWLFIIARNRMYDMVKLMGDRPKHSLEAVMEYPATDGSPDDDVQVREIRAVLQKAILRLPEKQRLAYELIKIEGLSREEAAARLAVAPETVKSNLDIAVRRIRAYCQKELDWELLIALVVIFL
ncbi:RNA polymerase sigma factor [Chitinophaga defluvii]|uniref:Sigma-70 family RNA polymerase sigma factor n=1 Tax=Chitinophaga defluvii TaxID=3163343 RepID=A0ABV2TCH8_9BACT